MFNVIKLLAWFEKLIRDAFYDTIFSELSHLVQYLKLRTLWDILILRRDFVPGKPVLQNFADFETICIAF